MVTDNSRRTAQLRMPERQGAASLASCPQVRTRRAARPHACSLPSEIMSDEIFLRPSVGSPAASPLAATPLADQALEKSELLLQQLASHMHGGTATARLGEHLEEEPNGVDRQVVADLVGVASEFLQSFRRLRSSVDDATEAPSVSSSPSENGIVLHESLLVDLSGRLSLAQLPHLRLLGEECTSVGGAIDKTDARWRGSTFTRSDSGVGVADAKGPHTTSSLSGCAKLGVEGEVSRRRHRRLCVTTAAPEDTDADVSSKSGNDNAGFNAHVEAVQTPTGTMQLADRALMRSELLLEEMSAELGSSASGSDAGSLSLRNHCGTSAARLPDAAKTVDRRVVTDLVRAVSSLLQSNRDLQVAYSPSSPTSSYSCSREIKEIADGLRTLAKGSRETSSSASTALPSSLSVSTPSLDVSSCSTSCSSFQFPSPRLSCTRSSLSAGMQAGHVYGACPRQRIRGGDVIAVPQNVFGRPRATQHVMCQPSPILSHRQLIGCVA